MNESSLRVGLLSRLALVLVLLLALDAAACYFTALYFANLVYDRWLIDSDRSLAQAVRSEHGRIEFDVPLVALQIFQFDEVDKTYFKISSDKRGYIAGEQSLHGGGVAINGIQLTNATVARQPVREVATRIAPADTDDTVTVTVAETLIKRQTLVRDILLAMVAPQVALLGIALVLAWLGISRGLKPLTDLASQIEARDVNNLTPVPQTGLPREARVLAARINELLARLSNAMRAQKRFVADAAHQLRTPLANVLLLTERAERATSDEPRRQALNGLHSAVARAARLSHQLLALARAEPEAAANLALAPLDLVAVARATGEEWITPALDRGIDFGFVEPGAAVMIQGHRGLLGELIGNLIDNALRYCPRGSKVTLSVAAQPQPILSVEDDGPGIAAESRERIFERFYRGDDSGGEGCGLGLAIVREITIGHGASVQVLTGHEGRGACFQVRFASLA